MMLLNQLYAALLRLLITPIYGFILVSTQRVLVKHVTPSDVIKSSAYPATSNNDVGWTIEVTQDRQILLEFLDFSINETLSCTADIFELHDGGRMDNVTVFTWCWDQTNKLPSTTYISSSNVFYLRLITRDGYTRRGFRARYTSINLGHTNSFGEIKSPQYPITRKVDIAWRIKVATGYWIQLQFLDFGIHQTPLCDGDFFQLFEAQHNAASLLYKWCWRTFGQLNRTTYTFSSNIIYLRLKTSQGFTRTGFKANYTRIPPVTTATIGRNGDTFSKEFSGLGTTFSEVASTSTNNESASTDTTTQLMQDQLHFFWGYIVGVVVIFLFIICFLLGCCFYCTKIKSNEKESGILNDVTELDKLPPAQQLDTKVSCSNIVTSQRGEITLEDDQVYNKSKTYTESTLVYASATQTGHTEESNSINEFLKDSATNELQNKEIHNLQEISYDMPEERMKDDTNQGEIKHEYDSIDSSKAKSKRTQFGTVSYAAYNDINDSFPVEKRFEHNEVPQDVPYKSFDKKDKYGIEVDGVLYSLPDKKKRDSMEMVTNEAYQSYDAEKGQEGVAGGQSPYYYVERNDGRDIGKESEILYDSVESQKQY